MARGVLGRLIPQAGDESKSGADGALECAEEDSEDAEAGKISSSAMAAENHGPYDASFRVRLALTKVEEKWPYIEAAMVLARGSLTRRMETG